MKEKTITIMERGKKKNPARGAKGLILAAVILLVLGAALGAEEQKRDFSIEGIHTISISYHTGKIGLAETGGSRLLLEEELRRMEPAQVKTSEGALSIESSKGKWSPFWAPWKNNARIAIPRSFQGNLRITLRSGALKGESDLATPGEISITLTSGTITLRRLSAGKIDMELTSGSCRAGNLEGETRIKLTSGSILCGELSGPSHRLELVSGSAKLDRIRGRINASAVSGTIKAEAAEITGDMHFRIDSGRMELVLPRGSAFNLDAETNSGYINLRSSAESFDIKNKTSVLRPIGENPRHTIFVRMNSGWIVIDR
ncbi:MAG: DUF4097 domain-containing protein [Treponema sp.]|jgi:DUF4097 and DUF4098 domain-containing protein YvlB|nr:DUF4097 domain-containing protein [Treponema sp.]